MLGPQASRPGRSGSGPRGHEMGFGGRDFAGRERSAGHQRAGRGNGEREDNRKKDQKFSPEDIKLALLKLLSAQPAQGHQLVQQMEAKLPGSKLCRAETVYPYLSLMEDEGLVELSTPENRKLYSISAEGRKFYESNIERAEAIFTAQPGPSHPQTRSNGSGSRPVIVAEAIGNLRNAIHARAANGELPQEKLAKIAEAINLAVQTIQKA